MRRQVEWVVRAQYTGGNVMEWTEEFHPDAVRRFEFIRDRAEIDWVEMIEKTTTVTLEKIERIEKNKVGG